MTSFYPGPSKIYPQVSGLMKEAVKSGMLSINHRSKEFIDLSRETILLLKKKINIPASYSVFFTSSATECWEIIAQSLIINSSYHIYNGSFGEKWFEYTFKLKSEISSYTFQYYTELNIAKVNIPEITEVICLTQNETSNGTQISNELIEKIRIKYPKKLIAVDATSSMAGINLKITNADIWFASIQKCFGLPAGMGVMICSPSAIKKGLHINDKNHYNSLTLMIEKMENWQTPYTPNVLSIFLLNKILHSIPGIKETEKIILNRSEKWYTFLSEFKSIKPLIENPSARSKTVVCVEGNEKTIKQIKLKAKKEGFLLGNGYGKWSSNTFRIANFPALSDKEVSSLKSFFKKYVK